MDILIEGRRVAGCRIMQDYVEAVEDDARIGKQRCKWCGKTTEISNTCPNCGKSGYIEHFSVNRK